MDASTIWAFDIGSRSIGWAVLAADDEGKPTGEVVDSNVIIHSGGVLDEKTGITRRGDRGQVVRQRRRLRRRVSRRSDLERLLEESGIARQEGWRERNPWWCRHELAAGPVEDGAKLRHLLATALPHMSRHRGWRNPWLRAPHPLEVKMDERIVEAANALSDPSAGDVVPDTLGAISWRLINDPGRAKIRQNGREHGEDVTNISGWIPKVQQEHIASELAYIWEIQSPSHPELLTDELLAQLAEQILWQEKPGVPLERIGRCEFDDRLYRAPRASLHFQRYRALDKLGNLRLISENGRGDDGKRPLTDEERSVVLERFLSGDSSTWPEIEELLDVEEGSLVHSDSDGTSGPPARHQIHERLYAMKETGIKRLRDWWEDAEEVDREVLIGLAISDRTVEVEYPELAEEIAQEIEDLGMLELVEKFGRSLPSGRASYSRQVLEDLNREMDKGADLFTAKQNTYGFEAEGAHLRWEDPVPHGGVEYSMRKMRELVPALERRYGRPSRVGIEIVREATLAHDERLERNARNKRLRESRNAARSQLRDDLGIERPTNQQITKREHLNVQLNHCLYCGDTIHMRDVELDHIVPRAIGGSTQFENLAAVCRPCNHRKGDRPFAAWCEADGEAGVQRLEETLERVDMLHGERWKATPAKPFFDAEKKRWIISETERARRHFKRRLKKKSLDPELGEGDLHSTAYVAREMRARFEVRYPEAEVRVLSGGMTAALRREGKLPRLLGAGDTKDRSDRRHHAVDAISVGILTHDTWASRVRRRDDAFKSRDLGLIGEEKFQDVVRRAPTEELREALERTKASARPILEGIVPVYERRLRVTGRIHEDTVRAWVPREIGREWGPTEISSIRDKEIRNALWRLSSKSGTLTADPERRVVLPGGSVLLAADQVHCALKVNEETGNETATATWLPVRKGWCKSDGLHHARLMQVHWTEGEEHRDEPMLVPIPIGDVYEDPKPFECETGAEAIAVRSHPKLARAFAFSAAPVLDLDSVITQGDVILDVDGAWRVTTFNSRFNRAEAIDAHHGGEVKPTKRSFAAAKFYSGEAELVKRDDLGHIVLSP